MSEAAPEAPAQEPTADAAAGDGIASQPQSWDDLFKGEDPAKVKQALDESRKWESRAKSNADAAKRVAEFEKERQAAMTDAERAVSEAEAKGRTAATAEFGKRLATSEIRAAAADAQADLAGVFDYLDLTRFVAEDGEPDEKAIKAFVDGLPKKDSGTPSFDGGTRTPPPAQQGMSGLIRKAAGRA